jgi:hypothetical protein
VRTHAAASGVLTHTSGNSGSTGRTGVNDGAGDRPAGAAGVAAVVCVSEAVGPDGGAGEDVAGALPADGEGAAGAAAAPDLRRAAPRERAPGRLCDEPADNPARRNARGNCFAKYSGVISRR